MRILIVAPYLPHPKAGHGTGVFMYGLLKHLSTRHEITLLFFCDEIESRLASDLSKLPIQLHIIPRSKGVRGGDLIRNIRLAIARGFQLLSSLITWKPYYVAKYRDPRMASQLRTLTEQSKFDVVQIEFSHLGEYWKDVAAGATVLHEHDLAFRPHYRRFKKETSLVTKTALFLEWCRWSRYDKMIVHKFNRVLTVTEQDRRLLQRISHSNNIGYLPRGVDMPENDVKTSTRERMSLLFVGTFRHQPNVDAVEWLLREIFPLVVREHPGATLDIVGAEPPPLVKDLANALSSVRLHGFVDDVNNFLDRSTVFVAPLRFGGGVKVKILHAMSRCIPIVTTSIGAEGIDGVSPQSLLIANSAELVAKHVNFLLDNSNAASELGRGGYALVSRNYSWESIVNRLENEYQMAVIAQKGAVRD